MKRFVSILTVALLVMINIHGQTNIVITQNDGSSWEENCSNYFEIDFSTNTMKVSDKELQMSMLREISFNRDGVCWNLPWRDNYGTRAYMFGYGAIMHIRDLMTADMTSDFSTYDWFSDFSSNQYLGKKYIHSNYVWGYMKDMIIDANEWILALKNHPETPEIQGELGAALASRALLYLDIARMYEFLPNDRTNNQSPLGQDITGLTAPIFTETMTADTLTHLYYAPRVSRQEMAEFIEQDLNDAEAVIGQLTESSRQLPHLDAVYGLKARLYMWIGDYQKALDYARRAIDATTTNPLTRDEMLSTTKGFNDLSKWMWGVQYHSTEPSIKGYVNWASWLCNEYNDSYTSKVPAMIGKSLYDQINDGDVRKLLWIAPSGSAFESQVPRTNPYINLPTYASVKFRPNEGSSVKGIATCTAFPLMRVEEMYFIEAEAVAQMGNIAEGARLLNTFMSNYRDVSYQKQFNSQQDLIDEIILQKRIELWGEGQTFFDVKRLNMPVIRDYVDTNFPYRNRFNTSGRPAWMNFVFGNTEETDNYGLTDYNNPDPSNVYEEDYKSLLSTEEAQAAIQGDVQLKEPAFVGKLDVVPLDSVSGILFHLDIPDHSKDVSFEGRLQISLSPEFPSNQTQTLSNITIGNNSSVDVEVYGITTMAPYLRFLLLQQGRNDKETATVYLRVMMPVNECPTLQLYSNTISFRAQTNGLDYYGRGCSYAPKLTASPIGVIDMERHASDTSFPVCNISITGEGDFYSARSVDKDFPLTLDLNLWNIYFNVNKNGEANNFPNGENKAETFTSLYKLNWSNELNVPVSEVPYPGKQDYHAYLSGYIVRDDLVFSYYEYFDLSILHNQQVWKEYDHNWSDRQTTLMQSERSSSNTVDYEKDTNSDTYRLIAPYAIGHNLMLNVTTTDTGVSNVIMPRQYAYDENGQVFWASGTGTFTGKVFDMQVTFTNESSTQTFTCHEIYGMESEWKAIYKGVYSTIAFEESIDGVLYQNVLDNNKYKIVPFIYNNDGLEFSVNDETGKLSFKKTETGYQHPNFGMVSAEDYQTGYMESTATGPVFHFVILYTCEVGAFGVYSETFTTTTSDVSGSRINTPVERENRVYFKGKFVPKGIKMVEPIN